MLWDWEGENKEKKEMNKIREREKVFEEEETMAEQWTESQSSWEESEKKLYFAYVVRVGPNIKHLYTIFLLFGVFLSFSQGNLCFLFCLHKPMKYLNFVRHL